MPDPLWMKIIPKTYRGFIGFALAACSFGALAVTIATTAVGKVDDRVHVIVDPMLKAAKAKHLRYDRLLAVQTVLLQHLLEDTEALRELRGVKRHTKAELEEEIRRALEFEKKYGPAIGLLDGED